MARGLLLGSTITDLSNFPVKLSGRDMRLIFGFSESAFYRQLAAGAFDRFELKPRIGPRAWSRTKVQRYLDQEGK